MQVRCVECHEPIDVAEDTQFGSMTCPSCGSAFSLLGEETIAYEGKPGDDADFIVRTLGHFELVDLLGSGSFGSVWMARDTELDRTVAVKIPRKGQLNPAEAEQFLREARAAAQLQHPNIVTVHEVGREDDTVYIVNDFVRGMPMDDWIAEQQITQREAAEICAKIADALEHAHQAGITHRDLKPGNVMIDLAGEPHIMDFGLAKREVGEVTMTVDGRILGTPAYMPPEQARGEGHKADGRSDIYSLGVMLYRLLTGELPFRGSPQMLIMQILSEEPPTPRKLDAHVARDLETICLKCMEKAPESRYQTAAEVAAELRRWLAGEPIVARPISRTERLWRWAKRNPGVAGLTGAVAALLVVIAVGSLAAAARLAFARDEALVARNEAIEAQRLTEQREQEAISAKKEADAARLRAEQNEQTAVASLGTALDGVERIAGLLGKLEGDPDLNSARVFAVAADIFAQHGRHRLAQAQSEQAYRIAKQCVDANPLDGNAKWFLSVRANELANACLLLGEDEPARTYYSEALQLRTDLNAAYPGVPRIEDGIALCHVYLGDVARNGGELDQAEQHYEKALEQRGALLDAAPEGQLAARRANVRAVHEKLGGLHLVWTNDIAAAQKDFTESLRLAELLADQPPDPFAANFDLAIAHEDLGKALRAAGEDQKALEHYEEALALLRQLSGASDRDVKEVISVQEHLAIVLARTGRHVAADQMARQIRAMRDQDERNLYNVACCYALCVAAVASEQQREGGNPSPSQLHDHYADEAFAALRRAVELGMDNAAFLSIDPDLAAIRDEPRFQKVLAEIHERRAAPSE